MIIQIILITLLIFIAVNFIGSRNTARTKAIKKMLLLLTLPAAITAVLFPSATTDIAHIVGVGRGADLIIYCITVIVIFRSFDSYIKDKLEQQRSTKIVRKIALDEAISNPHNKKK